MSTPEELAPADGLRTAIAEAREELRAAIAGAGDAWERKPASGDGEAAWTPRQTAEHIVGSHVRYAKAVCDACGYPGPETMTNSFATVADALEGLEKAVAASQSRLKYVSGKDLQMQHERMGSVEKIMMDDASHLRDHAVQIRAASV